MRKLRNVPIIGVSVLTLAGCGGGGETSTAQGTVTVEATSSAAEAAPTSIDPSKINPNTWGSVEDVKAFIAEKSGVSCQPGEWMSYSYGESCTVGDMEYIVDYSADHAFMNRMLMNRGDSQMMKIYGDTWTIMCVGEAAGDVCGALRSELTEADFIGPIAR